MDLKLDLNYADMAIGILLALGFLKGFMAGFWASVLNLAGMFASLLRGLFFYRPGRKLPGADQRLGYPDGGTVG